MRRILFSGVVVILLMALLGPGAAQARKESVETLVRKLRSKDYKARVQALGDLRWWGVAAVGAVPDLVAALKDPTLSVRLGAIRALGAVGEGAAPAVSTLVELIREEKQMENDWVDFGVADEAIGALGSIGAPAQSAVPILVETLGSKQEGVRQSGLRALGSLGPAALEAAPRLVKFLREPRNRFLAAWAVWRTGSQVPAILPVLREGMSSADDDDRLFAMAVLGLVGPAGASLRPQIVASLRDPYPRVRLFAARALVRQGVEARTFLPTLLECLDPRHPTGSGSRVSDTDFWDAERAAELVGTLGSQAESAIPRLVAAVGDGESRVVSPACTALSALCTENFPQEPVLLAALVRMVALQERGDVPVAIRTRAARCVSRLGARARSAVPALLDCFRSDAPGLVRATAGAAVLAIEPQNEEVLSALRPLAPDLGRLLFKPQEGAFDSFDPREERMVEVRLFWLDTLARLGPGAREALPFVQAARGFADERVRAAAVRAEKALQDPDPSGVAEPRRLVVVP